MYRESNKTKQNKNATKPVLTGPLCQTMINAAHADSKERRAETFT
jgi:hypothetical protein